jgi:hypothetical protein
MRFASLLLLLVNFACGIKAPPRPPAPEPADAQTSTVAHSPSTGRSAPR